jgi:phosphoserine phosphatase
MIAGVKQAGLKILPVSGGFTRVTERLKTRLGLDYVRSNTLGVQDGTFTGELIGRIVNSDGKREALLSARDELGATKDQIIAIGDGANYFKFMGEAGVSIAYRAKQVVREKATWCFDYVGLDGLLNLYASSSEVISSAHRRKWRMSDIGLLLKILQLDPLTDHRANG